MTTRWPTFTAAITTEADVVALRQRSRRAAELIGFDAQDQTRIATAVSEIARNAFDYGGGGRAELSVGCDAQGVQVLFVRISDAGPGIPDIDAILEGRFKSREGMGVGLVGARRLTDIFSIRSGAQAGTTVELGKRFNSRQKPLSEAAHRAVIEQLDRERARADPLALLSEQNRELARSLSELELRQEELRRLNRELEDTNKGVVALYAELDARAEQLREASELKTRFLSNMSHEFRTPVNSILALAHLLLERVDGDLGPEQERQVNYIKRSAQDLADLVNDFLDIAKVEAGKVDVRPARVSIADLFSALRGALKPLQTRPSVELVLEAVAGPLPPLFTDEAKLAQILRNLISNALKFTELGEVRVEAERVGDRALFRVSDTGVGIAAEDQARIFEEFTQIENSLQRHVKGTGLGLPLSRKLASLLGGEIAVRSEPGRGSTFTLSIPAFPDVAAEGLAAAAPDRPEWPEQFPETILVIDDDEAFRYTVRHLVAGPGCHIREAATGQEGLRMARELQPDAIILDLQGPGLDGFAVLDELSADPATRDIPVLVSSSMALDEPVRKRLLRARGFIPKASLSREALSGALGKLAIRA